MLIIKDQILTDVSRILTDLPKLSWWECRFAFKRDNVVHFFYANKYDRLFEHSSFHDPGTTTYTRYMGTHTNFCHDVEELHYQLYSVYLQGYRLHSIMFSSTLSCIPKGIIKDAHYLLTTEYPVKQFSVYNKHDELLVKVPSGVGLDLSAKHKLDIVFDL